MCCCILLLFNGADANYMGLLIIDISDKVKGARFKLGNILEQVGRWDHDHDVSKAGKHLEACFLHLLEL
jgi:hypothetical protein